MANRHKRKPNFLPVFKSFNLRNRLSTVAAVTIVIGGLAVLVWAIVTGRIGFFAATGQTITLSPSTTTVNKDQIFPVTVRVSTNNLNTVVATAELTYTSTDLVVDSFTPVGNALGTAATVYDYVVEEVNQSGLFRVTRGQPGDKQTNDSDDGFTGTNGTLVLVNFKAIRNAASSITTVITVNQANSAIVADDGNGAQELDSVTGTTVTINPSVGPTVSVVLTANPTSGIAPLNDVDLTAAVSGTATGDIRYRFDCTNDGTYEMDMTTSQNPHTHADVCDYPSVGTYTAKVRVDRQSVFAEDTETIIVNAPATVSVALSASPSSGSAPLNDVDLTADVSGTAVGNIRYRFDCTNNGDYEHDVTNSIDPYSAADLCDYASAGTYTARVRVDRGALNAINTTTITVSPPPPPPPPPPPGPPPTPPPPPSPVTTTCTPSTNPGDYHYVWVRQNGYPTLDWGQAYRFEVTVRNTGGATWCQGTVNLGTDRARDRIPGFIREGDGPSGWRTPNRVELSQGSVAPGQEGTFVFWMRVPQDKTPGTYREYFRVVADPIVWMEDFGIYWDVLVPSLADSYHAGYVSQNGYPTLRRGQSYQFEVKLKNTGVKTWQKNLVNLGTSRPRDVVYNWIREGGSPTGWLSPNRVYLVENSVAPGATGTYRFWRIAPDNKPFGCYRDYFQPVADGITWMDDWGVYWDICVVP